ncbi:hypothetical protein F6J84_09740 [Microbacterium caowuchunii]|uniref:Rid family hydrolase n=1 Tax=Microbacterium caowuchunii TaxID=2614638 RepID=UPI0012488BED|nr:Rid family hydrolase [Microbacterium caowuchunii]QEW00345.1 hypothetical protein F6J84_09740 [Microbacterium caowuchunii]
MTSDRRVIAPWAGDEKIGYLQGGIETTGGNILWLSGTTATRERQAQHVGDIAAQAVFALEKTGTALREAGYEWSDVVRLNWYVKASHLEQFWAVGNDAVGRFLGEVGCKAAGVFLAVESLAHPDMLCEFEATAVK